jgi:hypothetical protein
LKDELITLLETLGYPVFLQGSVNSVEDYPESFFTIWNYDTPEGAFYDNDANRAVWGFWVYFYSIDPELVAEMPEAARQLLKQHDWTPVGRAHDITTDAVTHTGAFFDVLKMDNYNTN